MEEITQNLKENWQKKLKKLQHESDAFEVVIDKFKKESKEYQEKNKNTMIWMVKQQFKLKQQIADEKKKILEKQTGIDEIWERLKQLKQHPKYKEMETMRE